METNNKKIIRDSLDKGFKSGIAGSSAMVIQVCSLMWLRTTMNYQYRYGTTTLQALKTLYVQGGIPRFYRGITPALLQGPLSRFGDTAANTAVIELLNSNPKTKDLNIGIKSACASFGAALWRINLMPIDTLKTCLQVNGKKGVDILLQKYKEGGAKIFYHGSLGAFGATYVGHFPWFATYNFLDEKLEPQKEPLKKLTRNATIGFFSSLVSDTCSNSIRVLKTQKQTYEKPISYWKCGEMIIEKEGWLGLFGRGLKTRIISNGIQGMMFSVLWKFFSQN